MLEEAYLEHTPFSYIHLILSELLCKLWRNYTLEMSMQHDANLSDFMKLYLFGKKILLL